MINNVDGEYAEMFAPTTDAKDRIVLALTAADVPTSVRNVTWNPETMGDPNRVRQWIVMFHHHDRPKALLAVMAQAEQAFIDFRNLYLDIDKLDDEKEPAYVIAAAESLEDAFSFIESCVRTLETAAEELAPTEQPR